MTEIKQIVVAPADTLTTNEKILGLGLDNCVYEWSWLQGAWGPYSKPKDHGWRVA